MRLIRETKFCQIEAGSEGISKPGAGADQNSIKEIYYFSPNTWSLTFLWHSLFKSEPFILGAFIEGGLLYSLLSRRGCLFQYIYLLIVQWSAGPIIKDEMAIFFSVIFGLFLFLYVRARISSLCCGGKN